MDPPSPSPARPTSETDIATALAGVLHIEPPRCTVVAGVATLMLMCVDAVAVCWCWPFDRNSAVYRCPCSGTSTTSLRREGRSMCRSAFLDLRRRSPAGRIDERQVIGDCSRCSRCSRGVSRRVGSVAGRECRFGPCWLRDRGGGRRATRAVCSFRRLLGVCSGGVQWPAGFGAVGGRE